jgi:(1->4)-alpha-D-glucan 1-alpha-D-glucosylmutase
VGLTEEPEAYAALARDFLARAEKHRQNGFPEPHTMLVALQTLVGAWPLPVERLAQYLEKASREAKRHTSWTRQDETYEKALKDWAAGVCGDAAIAALLEKFVRPRIPLARAVSLGWTLCKLTMPGVPDLYQGTERWSLDLVDPDNRRPVDWAASAKLLDELQGPTKAFPSLADDEAGRAKLLVVQRTLALRKERPELFAAEATYEPLAISGPNADAAIAYARRPASGEGALIVAVTRYPARVRGGFGSESVLALPSSVGSCHDLILDVTHRPASGKSGALRLDDLFARAPVALLLSDAK